MRKYLIFLSLVLLFLPSNSPAYNDLGTSTRATGMGAFVGVADEPSGVFYNPAGLSQLKNLQLGFLYAKMTNHGLGKSENPYLFSGVSNFWLSRNLTLGLAALQRGSWADPTNIITNNLGLLTLSYSLNSRIALGMNNKLMYNSNKGKKTGFDFDLGVLFFPYKNFSFGLVGENILAQDMTDGNYGIFNYPERNFKLGWAYKIGMENKSTLVAFDFITKERTEPEKRHYNLYSIGLEEWISAFGLRLGYTFGRQYGKDFSQPSFGLSFKIKGENPIRLDYSFQKYPYDSDKTTTGDHRLGIVYTFGNLKKPFLEESSQPKKQHISKDFYPERKASYVPGWLKFDLDVELDYLSSDQSSMTMFLLEPELDFSAKRWKILVAEKKPEDWKDIGNYLVRTLEGSGPPPSSAVWDGKDENLQRVKRGNYYFSLVLFDQNDQRWASSWKKFNLK